MTNTDNIISETLGIIKSKDKTISTPKIISPVDSNEDDIETDYKYQRENQSLINI